MEFDKGYISGIWDAIKHFKEEEGVSLERFYLSHDGDIVRVFVSGEEKEYFINETKPHYDADVFSEESFTPEKGNELKSILNFIENG